MTMHTGVNIRIEILLHYESIISCHATYWMNHLGCHNLACSHTIRLRYNCRKLMDHKIQSIDWDHHLRMHAQIWLSGNSIFHIDRMHNDLIILHGFLTHWHHRKSWNLRSYPDICNITLLSANFLSDFLHVHRFISIFSHTHWSFIIISTSACAYNQAIYISQHSLLIIEAYTHAHIHVGFFFYYVVPNKAKRERKRAQIHTHT